MLGLLLGAQAESSKSRKLKREAEAEGRAQPAQPQPGQLAGGAPEPRSTGPLRVWATGPRAPP